MKLDWREIDRGEPLVATLDNMRKCKDIPGIIMLSPNGNEYSANPNDYMLHDPHVEIRLGDENDPCILVQRMSYLINPLTREVV